jgi:hypothetical protein
MFYIVLPYLSFFRGCYGYGNPVRSGFLPAAAREPTAKSHPIAWEMWVIHHPEEDSETSEHIKRQQFVSSLQISTEHQKFVSSPQKDRTVKSYSRWMMISPSYSDANRREFHEFWPCWNFQTPVTVSGLGIVFQLFGRCADTATMSAFLYFTTFYCSDLYPSTWRETFQSLHTRKRFNLQFPWHLDSVFDASKDNSVLEAAVAL